jgi:hypothetical protein
LTPHHGIDAFPGATVDLLWFFCVAPELCTPNRRTVMMRGVHVSGVAD